MRINFNFLNFRKNNRQNDFAGAKKTGLDENLIKFEKVIEYGENVPFRIISIKENGFLVKTMGIFGFVAFNHMAWNYHRNEQWRNIYPYLVKKTFFAQVYRYEREPLTLVLNADIPQFKKVDLVLNMPYNGIVVNKTNYGLFIDIGYHFYWQCGSVVGMMHKSCLNSDSDFNKIKHGDLIESFYWGTTENNDIQLGNKTEIIEWIDGQIENLVGEILPVVVRKNPEEGKVIYHVDNKYFGTLPVTKKIYYLNRKRIQRAMEYLKDGDVIHCEVVKVNNLNKTLQLKWVIEAEIEMAFNYKPKIIIPTHKKQPLKQDIEFKERNQAIQNLLKKGIVEKLQLLGKQERILVSKTVDNDKIIKIGFTVYGKYPVDIVVRNTNYKISETERKKIFENLQHEEVLNCTIEKIEQNKLIAVWEINDDELFRFL